MAADSPANAPADAGAPAAASAANDASAGLPGPLRQQVYGARASATRAIKRSAHPPVSLRCTRIRPDLPGVDFLHAEVADAASFGHNIKHG